MAGRNSAMTARSRAGAISRMGALAAEITVRIVPASFINRRLRPVICSLNAKRGKSKSGDKPRQATEIDDGVLGRQHRTNDGVVQATRIYLPLLSARICNPTT